MIYLHLFVEFFRTGLFAVGGGMATIPFLYHISDSTGWYTHAQLADMIAISESTPGPIGVNMATYVGFTVAGVPGAMVATLGLLTPSVIIILMIARVLAKYRSNRYVEAVFYGLRPASCALIAAACFAVMKISILDLSAVGAAMIRWEYAALAAVVLILSRWVKPTKKLHPILFIAASAVAGIVIGAVQ